MKNFETWIGLSVFCVYAFDALALTFAIHMEDNQGLYNIAGVIEISLLFYVYHHLILSRKIRVGIVIVYALYVVAEALNILFIQKEHVLNTYTYVPAMACVAVLAFIHLRQCTDLNENPFRNLFFWFSIANLVDYLAGVPVVGTLSWYAFENKQASASLFVINNWLDVAWFSINSIGLIWTKTVLRTSPSM